MFESHIKKNLFSYIALNHAMRIDISKYENLLDKIELSSNNVLDQILGYPLVFDNYKNDEVEWKVKLPMFLDSFYPFVLKLSKVPTQEELWVHYLTLIPNELKNRGDDFLRGIKARLYRSYPSLVRDLHFSLLLNESSKHSEIIYNRDLDVKCGIDVLVIFKGINYAINLFTPTKRAYIGRNKKTHRHSMYENIVDIELPVKFNDEHKHGDFFLYGNQEIIQLRKKFKKLIYE